MGKMMEGGGQQKPFYKYACQANVSLTWPKVKIKESRHEKYLYKRTKFHALVAQVIIKINSKRQQLN